MFAFLPLITLILICLFFYKKNNILRPSILSGAIVWGLLLTTITESLSLGKSLTWEWLVGLWGLINIVLVYIYFQIPKKSSFNISKKLTFLKSPLSILLLSGVIFIVATVGLIALIAPPNNWDSMSYHMARVAHWIQNRSVDHYPAHYLPQLYQAPWAEFTITNLQILSGGDHYANLVQWFSMVGSIVGVSLIAQELGANWRGQIFSAVVAATIPMGILQGSSTQNDYVASFWLVCVSYFVIVSVKSRITPFNLLNVSVSLGLAILTKGTTYIYAFPFVVWFFVSNLRYLKWKVWQAILILGLTVIIINFGYYSRNISLFGTPLTPPSEKYTNDVFTIPAFISNIIKNLSLHYSIPLIPGTPTVLFHTLINNFIKIIHTFLGIDINDPRTTWIGQKFVLPGYIPYLLHEDSAPNFIHLLLIILTIILCITCVNLKKETYLLFYLISVVSTFFMLCFLLKWQPWNSRLHLPFFVLFSPLIGVVLSKIYNHKQIKYIAIILILSSLPWVLFNQSRPLISTAYSLTHGRLENIFNISRNNQYFTNRSELKIPYIKAANFLNSRKCSKIGLSLSPDDWEYPLWMLLKQNNMNPKMEIENVNVTNISVEISHIQPYNNFIPCAIISLESAKNDKKNQNMTTSLGTYIREFTLSPVSVFMKH